MVLFCRSPQEKLDYQFLLVTHMVCADGQIHSQELKYLKQLGDRTKISQDTTDEMEKILAKDDRHLTVDDVATRIPLIKRLNTMKQLLAIAYAKEVF